MPYTTLISIGDLAFHLRDDDWVIVDCRFSLNDPEQGHLAYQEEHIPGAVYAHLNDDLSAPHVPGKTGRHPLPSILDASATFTRLGIGPEVQVVAYDYAGGTIAARLWWMLRWLGHDAVAVLDGGFAAWLREHLPTESGTHTVPPRPFVAAPRPELLASADEVLGRPDGVPLFDARAAMRYAGKFEPIDSIAGHIPGAVNAPFADNLTPDGIFRPATELRERYTHLLGGAPPERAIVYCGSGVTATHDLLAMAHAGLTGSRLFAGSWSEWITDPNRPVTTLG